MTLIFFPVEEFVRFRFRLRPRDFFVYPCGRTASALSSAALVVEQPFDELPVFNRVGEVPGHVLVYGANVGVYPVDGLPVYQRVLEIVGRHLDGRHSLHKILGNP